MQKKGGKGGKGGGSKSGGGGGAGAGGASNPQLVIVLCGLPGSGKSTFSLELEKNENWVRINQDDLGSAAECKNQLAKTLKKKKSAIIDRCNASPGDRRMWIQEAKRAGVNHVEAIYLEIDREECIRRVQNRKGHPTLPGERAEEVIGSFHGGFSVPTEHEGFAKVTVLSSDVSIRNEISRLKALFPPKGGKKK